MDNNIVLGNLLFITHTWGGGISIYMEDMKDIFRNQFNIYVLSCSNGKVILEYEKNGKKKMVSYRMTVVLKLNDFSNMEYSNIISLILQAYKINIVHVNNTMGHTFDIFAIPKKFNIPVVYVAHDFMYICPTCHMVDKDGIYCNGCTFGNERENCLNNHPYIHCKNFDHNMLKRWRTEFIKVKGNIDLFIFPSFSTQNIYSSFFDIKKDKCQVIYHGNSLSKTEVYYNNGKELHVGIIGSILKHKGESLLHKIIKEINDDKIMFYCFGECNLKGKNLINCGPYLRPKIVELLKENKIDVVLLLSTWPETFSYTLSETLEAGIPPIVTNLGALKERIEKDEIGWVVDYKSHENICELLRDLRENKSKIEERSERIKRIHLKTMEEMKEEYLNIYNSFLSNNNLFRFNNLEVILAKLQLYKIKEKGYRKLFDYTNQKINTIMWKVKQILSKH